MRFLVNAGKLAFNFIMDIILSGWETGRVILRDPGIVNGGMTRMAYDDLDHATASLLGALISLTPGTTMIEQDLQRREFVLHILDLRKRDATIASIRRNLLTPLLELQGKRT